uniref:Uncharacterized protein n=1 Tax=Oryza brachyantha TaxID=4533 RepID=J3NCW8_ORYBR
MYRTNYWKLFVELFAIESEDFIQGLLLRGSYTRKTSSGNYDTERRVDALHSNLKKSLETSFRASCCEGHILGKPTQVHCLR